MRADYEYVDRTTSLVLSTTKKGSRYLSKRSEDTRGWGELEELLATVEEDYYIVPDGGLREWYCAYKEECTKTYGRCTISYETFRDAFVKGYLGVEKVIWD